MYAWNEQCNMHEIFDMIGTNFIRDDDRFENRRFHALLEAKIGRPFPLCLRNINTYLQTSADALKIADELCVFFPDDEPLMFFAKFLRQSAQYCSTYELSM